MNRNHVALMAGAVAGAAYQVAGHYGLHAPRLTLRPPLTYVYGTLGILFGVAVRETLGHDRLTTVDVAKITVANGLAVFGAYIVDALIDAAHMRAGNDDEQTYCA